MSSWLVYRFIILHVERGFLLASFGSLESFTFCACLSREYQPVLAMRRTCRRGLAAKLGKLTYLSHGISWDDRHWCNNSISTAATFSNQPKGWLMQFPTNSIVIYRWAELLLNCFFSRTERQKCVEICRRWWRAKNETAKRRRVVTSDIQLRAECGSKCN